MSTLQSTSLKIIILFSGLHKLLHSNITRLSSLVGIEPLIFRDIDQIVDHRAKKSNGTRLVLNTTHCSPNAQFRFVYNTKPVI